MSSISLCMIALNEAALLPRAAANWREWADELLVVVDSRTTDNTAEIVARMGGTALTYEYVHPGNKGAARNVGLDAATGDWIVVLDADEVIRNPAQLRELVEHAPNDMHAFNALFENYSGGGHVDLRWYQVRVFRRGLYRYRHREHELPIWCGEGAPNEPITDIVFEHRAPAARKPGKLSPMLERLRLDVEEHPDDAHPLYFLHRQYLLAGEWEAALEHGRRYLDHPGEIDRCECLGNMAIAYLNLGDTCEAIRCLALATAEHPQRRIWWIRLAKIYMDLGDWNVALAHLRLATELMPSFWWQWEPEESAAGMGRLIDECQRHLAQN